MQSGWRGQWDLGGVAGAESRGSGGAAGPGRRHQVESRGCVQAGCD